MMDPRLELPRRQHRRERPLPVAPAEMGAAQRLNRLIYRRVGDGAARKWSDAHVTRVPFES